MKKKRIVSIVLMIVMIMSLIPSVYAEGEPDYGKILSFEDLRKAIKTTKSSFDTDEDKDMFRHTYWEPVLPDKSKQVYPKGHKYAGELIGVNNESVDAFKIFYYGYGALIQDNASDSNGNKNYLGYTADGRHVVNMLYNEKTMLNPKKEPIDKYFGKPNVKYYGQVRPFRTNYTKPYVVGKMYLGEDATYAETVQYGKLILLEWMKHTKVRDTGWGKKGQTFYEVFGGNVNEFAKYVAITSPPTSRSNGQATMWFISDNGLPKNRMPNGKYQTRRTFVIEKTDPVDFIAKDYDWDESTKTLTVRYEVEGLEIVNGDVNYLLFGDIKGGNIDDEKDDPYIGLKSFFNGKSPEIVQDTLYVLGDVLEYRGYYMHKDNPKGRNLIEIYRYLFPNDDGKVDYGIFDHFTVNKIKPKLIYVNGKPQRKTEYAVKFWMPYLNDIRESELNFVCNINSPVDGPYDMFPEQSKKSEYPYDNNLIDIVIPPTGIDFILTHDNGETKKEITVVGDEDVKVPVSIELGGVSGDKVAKGEVIKTDMVIFDKDGKVIDTLKDVEFTKENLVEGALVKNLDLMIKKDLIKQGENKFYIVINSDFDLKEAKPIKEEYNLKNNKIEVVILKGEEDFEIISNKHRIEIDKKDKGEIELSYTVNLKGTEKEIPTVVDLYRGDKIVESINIKSKGGTSQEVKFKVPIDILEEGVNNFYGIVNADYNLKVARPYKEEKDLSNNKDEIIVVLGEEIEEKSGECEFSGGAGSKTYSVWTCDSWRWNEKKGKNVCTSGWYCKDYTLGTQNHAKLEYKEYSLGSNLYRTDKKGQEYGEKHQVPRGKDLEGNPSYDELMAKIGYNPLYQVIQTGRGMQVKGVVRLTGGVQAFSSSAADSLIKDFVEDIKKNIFAGSKAKNNEGKEYQQMIEDTTRTGIYTVDDKGFVTYGSSRCKQKLQGFYFEVHLINR